MRVGIATVQVPFIQGGAEDHAASLRQALRGAGHEVDIITMPFRFSPYNQVRRSMEIWENEDFGQMNGYHMDRIICLRFPTYYLQHPEKVVWLLHQHRAVYDLWETEFSGDLRHTPEGVALKQAITDRDTRTLAACKRVYGNSSTVARRLKQFNSLDSEPLYHPPKLAGKLYNAAPEPYIFCPSRLEGLKRQHLLLRAMAKVQSPVVALLAGDGGQRPEFERLIEELAVGHRVRLLGRVSDAEMLAYYAHALGVFFGPYHEDYGYITLEAMLSAKPVITCTDSGGPLEFVQDGITGYVAQPNPQEIADCIDQFYWNQQKAIDMGQAGLAHYQSLNISWDNVLEKLLSSGD